MQDLITIFLIVLVLLDFLMLLFFAFFYVKFRKVLKLPWDEIKESIEKAEALVKKLEEIEKGKKHGTSKTTSIKEEVIRLYREGKPVREISKLLGLSEAEVELIIKRK